jgi:hypothetical protein
MPFFANSFSMRFGESNVVVPDDLDPVTPPTLKAQHGLSAICNPYPA